MNLDEENQHLFDALPSHIAVGSMLKATPAMEGEKRFIYLEASNQSKDLQGEIVLAKALEDSADYYLKFGNLDLEHYTQIGAKRGIPHHESYDIGRPVAVNIEKGRTFVKGHIKSGTGVAAEKANLFWSSLTEVNPPEHWYPSVGGAVEGKSLVIDPVTKTKQAVITKVRWSNIGFSKTPVNPDLSLVQTSPFGPLAKSWGAAIFDSYKSLTAGYGSDVATLTGGAALRGQSLDGGAHEYMEHEYLDFRNKFAGLIRSKSISDLKLPTLVREARERFGLSAAVAAEYVEQFLNDLQSALKGKK